MNSGAYQLFITVTRKVKIKIGSLGTFLFTEGDYVYTGSAMKNLSKRVERHYKTNTNKSTKLHWHIDYLLKNKYVKIKYVKIIPSTTKIECELNQLILHQTNVDVPIKKFGSSDCSQCPAHLLKLPPSSKIANSINKNKNK